MNNDLLINQARRLYATLSVARYLGSLGNKERFRRLGRLISRAYSRYQRRINRCVLCYRQRRDDCPRDPDARRNCPALLKHYEEEGGLDRGD